MSKVSRVMTKPEREALTAYAMAAYDILDMIEYFNEDMSNAGRKELYTFLTHDNPNQSSTDRELNAIVAPIVKQLLQNHGIKI